jgi:hypothetical protein
VRFAYTASRMPVVLPTLLLGTVPALLPAQAPRPDPAPKPSESALAITYHERVVFVRARVNDAPDLLFLLDTGASATALDAGTAERLELPFGEPTRVEGTTGVIEVETVRLSELAIGPRTVREVTATVQDLSQALAPPGKRLDGILGHDILGGCALEIDFEAARLTLLDRPLAPQPDAIPFELDNGIPRVDAVLDGGVRTALRLDTGASLFATEDVYLNVPERVWEELRQRDPQLAPSQFFTGRGTGGEVRLPVARIGRLALGNRTVERPWVIVQPAQGYFARPDAVGFLGNNFLEKFGRVTIDYPGRQLVLGPRAP